MPVVNMTSTSAPVDVGQSEVSVNLNGVFRMESRACSVWTSTRYARAIFAPTRGVQVDNAIDMRRYVDAIGRRLSFMYI